MRLVLLPVLALSLAAPSLASATESQVAMEQMADRFNDPATQSALAEGLGGMLSAMMNMRIDGLAKALEPMNNGKRIKLKGNTLREMAMRDDPKFEQKLQMGTRAAVGGMGAMASAMAKIMPQLEAAMEKMGESMDRSFKDNAPSR